MLLNSDSTEHTLLLDSPMINETTNHGTILLKEMTLTKGNKLPITAASPQELRWWPYHSKLRAGAHIETSNSHVLTNSSWQVHAKSQRVNEEERFGYLIMKEQEISHVLMKC